MVAKGRAGKGEVSPLFWRALGFLLPGTAAGRPRHRRRAGEVAGCATILPAAYWTRVRALFGPGARRLILAAVWSARRRGGWYLEPEDLLHAFIREDRGEFAAIGAEWFPRAAVPMQDPAGDHPPFFAGQAAADLPRELHLAPAAQAHRDDRKTIEPLDLLAAIVEHRDSRLAQLLRDHGITRQKVAKAPGSGS